MPYNFWKFQTDRTYFSNWAEISQKTSPVLCTISVSFPVFLDYISSRLKVVSDGQIAKDAFFGGPDQN